MSEPLAPVDLVLVWHHHQPDYRHPRDGRAVLPWARLHATKDYLDMARHLDRHPGVRATFNLVPSLLDQIEAVAAGGPDELIDLLVRPLASLSPAERVALAWRCSQIPARACERWPACRTLRARAAGARPPAAGADGPGAGGALGDRDLLALEIWFLLGWVDPMFHGEPEVARALADHPRWSERHRDDLVALQRRLAAAVIPAYRALVERGQVELSTSPYYHPILPLLVDLASARRSQPAIPLPGERLTAPEDARWHIERALERHAAAFGAAPAGMWPSEGSVSPEAAQLAAASGVRWLASDEAVLRSSLPAAERIPGAHYRPWRFAADGHEIALFFRDRELSDRIGFVYSRWDAEEAAADFVARLRRIAREHAGATPPVVPVILDGENCWEHYREDGNPFLEAFYGALGAAPDIRTRTPSDVLAEATADGRPIPTLARLHSGSWIDADFHIWIGHPEKNRAWELVSRARRALVDAGRTPAEAPEAWHALYRAQGSDWFWWFGDDHHTYDKPVFDRLLRELLATVYREAGLAIPGALRLPIARESRPGAPQTEPIGFIRPVLDGRRTHFYEWHEGGHFALGGGGAMHRTSGLVTGLHYGFDGHRLYLRLDFGAGTAPGPDVDLVVEFLEPRPESLRVPGLGAGERPVMAGGGEAEERVVEGARCVVGPLLELAVPFSALALSPGDPVALIVHACRGGHVFESYPGEDGFGFTVPDAGYESAMWSA